MQRVPLIGRNETVLTATQPRSSVSQAGERFGRGCRDRDSIRNGRGRPQGHGPDRPSRTRRTLGRDQGCFDLLVTPERGEYPAGAGGRAPDSTRKVAGLNNASLHAGRRLLLRPPASFWMDFASVKMDINGVSHQNLRRLR